MWTVQVQVVSLVNTKIKYSAVQKVKLYLTDLFVYFRYIYIYYIYNIYTYSLKHRTHFYFLSHSVIQRVFFEKDFKKILNAITRFCDTKIDIYIVHDLSQHRKM